MTAEDKNLENQSKYIKDKQTTLIFKLKPLYAKSLPVEKTTFLDTIL